MIDAATYQSTAPPPGRRTGFALIPMCIVMVCVFLNPKRALSEELLPVPDPAVRRELVGHNPDSAASGAFTCHAPPPAVVELSIQSAYRPDDPTQSTIERSREEEYTKRVQALRLFTRGVNGLADQYVMTRPRDGRIALC